MIKGGRVLPECHGVVGTPRQACGHVESGKKKVLVTNLAGAAGRRRTAAAHIRMFRSHTGVIRFLSRSVSPPTPFTRHCFDSERLVCFPIEYVCGSLPRVRHTCKNHSMRILWRIVFCCLITHGGTGRQADKKEEGKGVQG